MRGEGGPAPVVVVGGGIAGLAAAWELTGRAPDAPVVVLEAADRVGGKILTGVIGGRAVDLGADAFVARRPEGRALCAQLGLQDDLVAPGRRGASVFARRRLRSLPAGLALGVPTRLRPLALSGICSPAGVARAATDKLKVAPRRNRRFGDADRSVGDIVGTLGTEVVERLADPLIGGIHAGSVRSMSAAAVFPPLLAAAARGGSLMRALQAEWPDSNAPSTEPVFLTPSGGMEQMVDVLAARLAGSGVEVRTGAAVRSLRPAATTGAGRFEVGMADGTDLDAAGVILAVPAGAAAALLGDLDEEAAALVGAVAYASVALVTMRVAGSDVEVPAEGTGFVVPRAEGRFITACTWMCAKWPHLRVEGEVLLRASVGRYGDDAGASLPDADIVARTLDDLGAIAALRGEPLQVCVTRWPSSFPQYTVGHLQRVAAVEKAVAAVAGGAGVAGGASGPGGLALAGAALHGVGIPACIASGRRAAGMVLSSLGAPLRGAQ